MIAGVNKQKIVYTVSTAFGRVAYREKHARDDLSLFQFFTSWDSFLRSNPDKTIAVYSDDAKQSKTNACFLVRAYMIIPKMQPIHAPRIDTRKRS
jgi:hypothetical protein